MPTSQLHTQLYQVRTFHFIEVYFSFLLFQCHFCHAQDIPIMFDVYTEICPDVQNVKQAV